MPNTNNSTSTLDGGKNKIYTGKRGGRYIKTRGGKKKYVGPCSK